MKLLKIILINTIITSVVVYVFSAVYLRHLADERIDAEMARLQSEGHSSVQSSSSYIASSNQSSNSYASSSSSAPASVSASTSSSQQMKNESGDGLPEAPIDYPVFHSTTAGFDNNSCFSAPEDFGIDWNKMAQDYFKDFDINHPDLEILANKHMHYEPSGMWFVYFKIPLPENLVNTQWVVLSFDGIVTTQPVYLKGIITYAENGRGEALSEPVIERGEVCLEETAVMQNKKYEEGVASRFVIKQEDGVSFKPTDVRVSSKRIVSLSVNNQQYEFSEPGYESLYNPKPFRVFGFEDSSARVYSLIELVDYSCSHIYLIYDVVNKKIVNSTGGGCG